MVSTDSALNILVVDDEPLASRRLRALCYRLDIVNKIAVAEHGRQAISLVQEFEPDVLLLDIDMPDLSGIDVARHFQDLANSPAIIFTTAHSRYAVQAFRLKATDYLLKPVKQDLLEEALERVKAQRLRDSPDDSKRADDAMWVRDGTSTLQIRSSDIHRIEAERDYMRLCMADRSYLVHEPMGSLENKLPADKFVRVHRSAIVRKDLIRDIRRKGRHRFLILADDAEVPIGPSYADNLTGIAGNQAGGSGLSETVTE